MEQVGHLQVCLDNKEVSLHGQGVPLGSRAFAILEMLIRQRGELVSKDALIRHVWPETIVEENNLQVQVTTLRKLLGEHRNLIRTIPGRGYVLIREESASNAVVVATPTGERVAPADPCRLFGRREAIEAVASNVSVSRLVTLVGAGGIGKTRLALEVAATVGPTYADGVVFVALAGVTDEGCVVHAVASALGIRAAGGPSNLPTSGQPTIADIVARTSTLHALLVLDNCEHLIDAAAEIVEAITASSPSMRVLATSREALRLKNELLYPVPPLAVPHEHATLTDSLSSSAVELFIARARAVDPNFPVDAQTVALTALVCRRLDGLPLAIELAAARAATLGIGVLLEHLDDRFRVLTGGLRTALPRHQTLRATFDWSYRLLSSCERTLFRRLGVFADGFPFEAACYMTACLGCSRAEVLEALGGLVAKSLVIHEHGNESSYRLLESTRAYAIQQLEDNGEYVCVMESYRAFRRAVADPFERGAGAAFDPFTPCEVYDQAGEIHREVSISAAQG